MKTHPSVLFPRLCVLWFLCALSAAGADPRFRADDGNLWRLDDNPALQSVSGDVFSVGYAVLPVGNPWNTFGNDLELISPLIGFHYTWKDADSTLRLGTAMGPWEGFSIGYRADKISLGASQTSTNNFGALWRPLDLVSAGLTLDDAFGPGRLWGVGLGLRPLTLWRTGGDGLTLTADAAWKGSQFAWERWGGRWSWQGSDLRVWYEPETRIPGLEVTLALGPAETTISPDRVGQALRWSSRTPELSAFGPVILKIQGTGTLMSSPVPPLPFNLGPHRWNLPELIALLHRAARDRQVLIVAIEDPPAVGGLAGAEDLRDALERLHKAGKKVYIHADGYQDSLGFQGWVAAADRVALDPSGSLNLTASASRRLYLKGFLDKIGVEFVNFAPWKTKSFYNNLTASSMPDEERAMMKRFLTDRDDLAATALAEGRGPRLRGDAATLVARGPYLVARDALDLGLVDALENRVAFEDFLKSSQPGATVVNDLARHRTPGWGPAVTRRTVALVHLSGDVVPGPGQAGRSIGRDAVETLRTLRADSSIRAILLRVDSPGGAVLPSDALADEVKKTVASGKPVVVVMGDLAASGGYYLSAPATRIFAEPGTLTGSIGVTAAWFTAEKALDLLGIKSDGVDQAPSAAFGDWTRPLSDTARAQWEAQIASIYQRFLSVVAEGRHLDPAVLEPLARGQIYTGREALALGLVDGLGGQKDAEAWLEKELGGPVEWKEFLPGDTDPFGGLLAPFAAAVAKSADSPSARLVASLDRWIAPWSEALTGVAARGAGPMVWVDAP